MYDRWVVLVEGNIVYFAGTAQQRAYDYAAQCRTHGKLAYVIPEAEYYSRYGTRPDNWTILRHVDRDRDL